MAAQIKKYRDYYETYTEYSNRLMAEAFWAERQAETEMEMAGLRQMYME
jgi:hypothetical protein